MISTSRALGGSTGSNERIVNISGPPERSIAAVCMVLGMVRCSAG
jgi:hypothetical protein